MSGSLFRCLRSRLCLRGLGQGLTSLSETTKLDGKVMVNILGKVMVNILTQCFSVILDKKLKIYLEMHVDLDSTRRLRF